ncbi:MAG: hypothetical protein M3319_00280 [Actinomycetota bacterium]|nr:hypothetical protein [Actinomycetota bacterium]
MSEQVGEQTTEVAVEESVGDPPEHSSAWSSAWARWSPRRNPGMRCPLLVMIGWCTAVKACSARIGLGLGCWTPSRRQLAKKPISRSADRWVSRFLTPKSLVSLIVVSV